VCGARLQCRNVAQDGRRWLCASAVGWCPRDTLLVVWGLVCGLLWVVWGLVWWSPGASKLRATGPWLQQRMSSGPLAGAWQVLNSIQELPCQSVPAHACRCSARVARSIATEFKCKAPGLCPSPLRRCPAAGCPWIDSEPLVCLAIDCNQGPNLKRHKSVRCCSAPLVPVSRISIILLASGLQHATWLVLSSR
jgi:hypothetical protein